MTMMANENDEEGEKTDNGEAISQWKPVAMKYSSINNDESQPKKWWKPMKNESIDS